MQSSFEKCCVFIGVGCWVKYHLIEWLIDAWVFFYCFQNNSNPYGNIASIPIGNKLEESLLPTLRQVLHCQLYIQRLLCSVFLEILTDFEVSDVSNQWSSNTKTMLFFSTLRFWESTVVCFINNSTITFKFRNPFIISGNWRNWDHQVYFILLRMWGRWLLKFEVE